MGMRIAKVLGIGIVAVAVLAAVSAAAFLGAVYALELGSRVNDPHKLSPRDYTPEEIAQAEAALDDIAIVNAAQVARGSLSAPDLAADAATSEPDPTDGDQPTWRLFAPVTVDGAAYVECHSQSQAQAFTVASEQRGPWHDNTPPPGDAIYAWGNVGDVVLVPRPAQADCLLGVLGKGLPEIASAP